MMRRILLSLSFFICHLFIGSIAAQGGYGTSDDFNPDNPGIPGANGIYLARGVVVLDGLRSGGSEDISDGIYSLWNRYCDEQGYEAYSSERNSDHMLEVFDAIHTVIVIADFSSPDYLGGMVNLSSDVGMYFRQLTTLDLSRTSGWRVDYGLGTDEYLEHLQVLILPDCVEQVVSMKNLHSLTDVYCYAELPPVMEESPWYGSTDLFASDTEVKVYVPTSSVPLYKASETWGKYNIVDAETDLGKIEVKMPQGVDLADYRNMYLMLTDEQTQLSTRYVVTDRKSYFFAGLSSDASTSYTVALVNRFGTVVCQQTGIRPEKGVTMVQLANPLPVKSVTLKVTTPEQVINQYGQTVFRDVTDQVSLTWYDAAGERITSSPTLAGLVVGDVVHYDVQLLPQLAQQFAPPVRQQLAIQESTSSTTLMLQRQQRHTILATLRDATTGQPLHEISVTGIQTMAEGVTNTYHSLSYTDGGVVLPVFEGPLKLSFSSSDYLRTDLERSILSSSGETVQLGDIRLKRVEGKQVTLNFSITEPVLSGEQQVTLPFTNFVQDLVVSITNATQQRPITDFTVQYPLVVIRSGAEPDDELEMHFSSASGVFDSVDRSVHLSYGGTATLNEVFSKKGGFQSTFQSTHNGRVAAIVYDSEGRYVNHYIHKSATLTVKGLSRGSYTLITMGYDPVISQLSTLQSFQDMGLQRDVDYLQESFTVNGQLARIEQGDVPTINVESLKVTHSSTSFSVSESNVVLGGYATVRARVKVKNDIAQNSWNYGNFRLLFDLPPDCTYLEGSLMVDGKTVSPGDEEGRMQVYASGLEEGKLIDVRFCLVGKTPGRHTVSGLVGYRQYDWQNGDRDYYAPVGASTFTVSPMQYEIVEETPANLIANGKAPRGATISAYVEGNLTAQTTVAGSTWAFDVPLPKSYNMASFPVRLECVTKEGNIYSSPEQYVRVNRDMNTVKRVTMLYPNAYAERTYTCEWQFLEVDDVVQTYDFYPSSVDFTFLIDFLNNDTTKVRDVELDVKLSSGKQVTLPTVFDEQRGCWVATFTANEGYATEQMPVDVAVSFDTSGIKMRVDREHLDAEQQEFDELLAEQNALAQLISGITEENVDQRMADFEAAVGYALLSGSLDAATINRLNALTQEEADAEAERLIAESEAMLSEWQGLIETVQQPASLSPFGTYTMDDGAQLTISDCSAYSEPDMAAQGFEGMEMTDGSFIYVRQAEDRSLVVDFKKGFALEMVYAQTIDGRRRSIDEVVNQGLEFLKTQVLGLATKALQKLLNEVSAYIIVVSQMKDSFLNNVQVTEYILDNCDLTMLTRMKMRAQLIKDKIALLAGEKALKVATKLPGIVRKIIPIVQYANIVADFGASFTEYDHLYHSVPMPCSGDYENASNARSMCENGALLLLGYTTGKLALQLYSDITTATTVVAAAPTGGTSALVGLAVYLVKQAAVFIADYAFNKAEQERMRQIKAIISNLQCDDEPPTPKPREEPSDPGEISRPRPSVKPLTPPKKPLIDPSGFVCEAVESNRLEGVTATCLYKKEVEDMYGDKQEQIVIWDAWNYGQVNPQLTDKDGMYAWMVPTGSWQVLYEKDGYETQRSAWLPVPPPQLDVNVGLVRRAQPALSEGHAYEQAIDVSFSLYMKGNYITPQTLTFWQDGQQLSGSLQAVNGEAAFGATVDEYDEVPAQQCASLFRFVPRKSLAVGSKVTVRALSICRSYADVPMGEDQELTLVVGREVTSIGADGTIVVPYGGTHQVVISAQPAIAAAHRVVTVSSLSTDIAALQTNQVVLDAEGKAYVTISGQLPGTTYLLFAVDGSQVSGMDTVRVVSQLDLVAAPQASIISGTYVEQGTQVVLTAQEGCTIWYTLDGSCPCDEAKRQRYTGPITINADTRLKAMAVTAEGRESEVVTFTWFIATAIQPPTLSKAPSSKVYDLQGRQRLQGTTSREVLIRDGRKVIGR